MQIERLIRGLSPFPGAFTMIEEGEITGVLKIGMARFVSASITGKSGTLNIQDKELHVAVKDGYLVLELLQPEGKRMMAAADFINGLREKDRPFLLV